MRCAGQGVGARTEQDVRREEEGGGGHAEGAPMKAIAGNGFVGSGDQYEGVFLARSAACSLSRVYVGFLLLLLCFLPG